MRRRRARAGPCAGVGPGECPAQTAPLRIGRRCAARRSQGPSTRRKRSTAGEDVELAPAAGVRSFHLHTDQRQIIQQVFKAYGIDATVDQSVRTLHPPGCGRRQFRAGGAHPGDDDGFLFRAAGRASRAGGARHKENRQQFIRQEFETVYLSGLTKEELTDVGNLAKNVFDVQDGGHRTQLRDHHAARAAPRRSRPSTPP